MDSQRIPTNSAAYKEQAKTQKTPPYLHGVRFIAALEYLVFRYMSKPPTYMKAYMTNCYKTIDNRNYAIPGLYDSNQWKMRKESLTFRKGKFEYLPGDPGFLSVLCSDPLSIFKQ